MAGADRAVEGLVRGEREHGRELLEDQLLSHPDIAQAAVIGVPDEALSESIRAVVVLAPDADLTLAALRAYLAGRGVARFKLPDSVVTVDTMPLTAAGKIDKKELRTRLGS